MRAPFVTTPSSGVSLPLPLLLPPPPVRYKRAKLALSKGEDELAKEALKRRKDFQVRAAATVACLAALLHASLRARPLACLAAAWLAGWLAACVYGKGAEPWEALQVAVHSAVAGWAAEL